MNAPTLYDRFIVPEGSRKVTFSADTKVTNAGTFVIQREDHTLGNLIRMCVAGPAVSRARAAARAAAVGALHRFCAFLYTSSATYACCTPTLLRRRAARARRAPPAPRESNPDPSA